MNYHTKVSDKRSCNYDAKLPQITTPRLVTKGPVIMMLNYHTKVSNKRSCNYDAKLPHQG